MTEQTPSKEQIKEIAEWCKFTDIRVLVNRLGWDGTDPSGKFKVVELDLNFLFQYAVPKLDRCTISMNVAPSGDIFWNAKAGIEGLHEVITTEDTPALALFWAIYEAAGLGKEIITHRSTSTDRNYHNDR